MVLECRVTRKLVGRSIRRLDWPGWSSAGRSGQKIGLQGRRKVDQDRKIGLKGRLKVDPDSKIGLKGRRKVDLDSKIGLKGRLKVLLGQEDRPGRSPEGRSGGFVGLVRRPERESPDQNRESQPEIYS